MCFYYDWDGEFSLLDTGHRKARKDRRCDACRKPILRGEIYSYQSAKYDGELSYYGWCGVCELMRFIIHLRELIEGCSWSNSWIAPDEIGDYCAEELIEMATKEQGQWFLKRRFDREAEQRRDRKLQLSAIGGPQ